jgi:serine phosphatase RsbU (regulator of sigma subunit)
MAFEDPFAGTLMGVGPLFRDATAADDHGHYLVVLSGAEPGRIVEIGAEPITIGRDAQQPIAFVGDRQMSRAHARVMLAGGLARVEDLGSTNGTFLDGVRLQGPTTLREGSVLQVGQQSLTYERRSRADVQRAQELERDLARASGYVRALLPDPITSGAVQTDWSFIPSTKLGGDAFGHDWIDPDTFAFYVMDVAGHGAGSAMHSVAIMNVLRQRVLPGVDFGKPAEVLASLNNRFEMSSHGGLYFTMWYGVYRPADRSLEFAAAGHHPAYLVPSGRLEAHPLGEPNLMVGAMPDVEYTAARTTVPPGSVVYVFSDGVFEIVTADDTRWTLHDFVPLLTQPLQPGVAESARLQQEIRRIAKAGPLDDDFSLLAVTFR